MSDSRTIFICRGTGCESSKSALLHDLLEEEITKHKLGSSVEVKKTGCHGFCQQGPLLVVEPDGVFYVQVTEKDIPEIVESHLIGGDPIERLYYVEPNTEEKIPKYDDIPFYSHQHRIILRNCGEIDPEKIDDYIARDGYEAIKKAVTQMTPEDVIEEIIKSGLRGRGGGGFPTGLKWKLARNAPGDEKYLVCNADEGDPGAFMDRSLLEADPHSVLEGMLIGAYSINAKNAFIYVRHEYPLAVQRFRKALKDATERGFIGENIFESSFSIHVHVKEGAGAFVCGEETALLASIEGQRGMPRPRPPYPTESGLWGKPTILNNTKSLASTPIILMKGADWFNQIGSEKSKGTAVFALTGKVENSGLVEVPMGSSLEHIIFNIGGGIQDDAEFKAVQTGGPSGGCIPAVDVELPVDYDSLTAAGTIMGSGGMIVMDESSCMVDVAHYFLSFAQEESCGKCTPCRVGTLEMLKILEKIKDGEGEEEDITKLLNLAETVKDGSLCGLGQTAPNPVLTTLRYFRDEYEAHTLEKRCPALVCKKLIQYSVIPDKCIGCGACKRICPANAITGENKKIHEISQDLCIKCGACFEVCPPKADAVLKGGAH
ncbi:MAG: NADH-ubiquinone oxidoreductase-F iron-sulfur binding region domain-containing protein [Candidatus Thorarchaeota archaeon]|jgi:NADH:ubiquinone oxidoreductase subunit F (NADH-binding)/(2Fe-2S) ferredoxin/Pyruvate/2-oxoacid:ferredoxin oxidoreductase delta subunit